jgi:hypothetical protein
MDNKLKRVSAGIKSLENALNRIIDAVNENRPIEGSGIRIEKNANGSIITLANQANGAPSNAVTGSSGTDDDSTLQAQITNLAARISSLETLLQNSSWSTVLTVDGACNKSTINVLTH